MARLKNFDEVFQNKLDKLIRLIKKERKKARKERNADFVKTIIKEAKYLKKLLKDD